MVYVLFENGFEQCEALSPVDILRRAGLEVACVGVSDIFIKSSHGVTIKADIPLSDVCLEDAEMLIIPGGQPGVDNLWANEAVRTLISEAYAKDIPIGAICAAPIILARLGLLDGKEAVCYPSCCDELKCAKYLPDTSVAQAGNIITGRAAGDALPFSFALLRMLCGTEAELKVRKAICYE